jgi:uncharacterized membrane protein
MREAARHGADNHRVTRAARNRASIAFAGEGTARIEAFSDGVFAIAITLLVLDLNLPPDTTDQNLAESLGSLWDDYFSFGLSFAIIGMYWISHHGLFRRISRFDVTLLWLNLLVLASVVSIPFPTRVISDYGGESIAIALYAGTLAVTGFSTVAVFWYAHRKKLLVREVTEADYRDSIVHMLVPTLVFTITVPLAFVTTRILLAWFCFFFIDRVVDRVMKFDVSDE